MKRLQGLIAATLTTIVISLGMLVIGVSAAANTNSVPVSNSPAEAAQASLASSAAVSTAGSAAANTASANAAAVAAQAQAQLTQAQAKIDQLQNLIKQYQDREKQYQTEIKSQAQKLTDANNQEATFQQVLQALQDRGLIQISRDGRIFVAGG